MKVLRKYKGHLYLILLLIALPVAVYGFAIGKTVSKWNGCRNTEKQITALRARGPGDNTGTAVAGGSEESIASGIFLEMIAEPLSGNKLSVQKYTPYMTKSESGVTVMTAETVIAGGYVPLVRLIGFIESEIENCKIVSVNFRSSKEIRTGRIDLNAAIVIQQITQTQ